MLCHQFIMLPYVYLTLYRYFVVTLLFRYDTLQCGKLRYAVTLPGIRYQYIGAQTSLSVQVYA